MDAVRDKPLTLDGYSGYEVALVKDPKNGYIVIKKSKSKEKNERLIRQYEKHCFFQNLREECFGVPEITGHGYDKDMFFYEYRFVEGSTLIKYIDGANQSDIENISDKLLKIMKHFASKSAIYYEKWAQMSMKEFLGKKVEENCAKCGLDDEIRRKFLSKIGNLPEKGRCLCHGDFTFDNIIVDEKGELWLIDYLDVYPHYWMDVSKLFQDIDGGWYEIKHGSKLPMNKLFFMRQYLLGEMDKIDPDYRRFHNIFLAVAFLRILPYSKSETDRRLIVEKIKNFLNIDG